MLPDLDVHRAMPARPLAFSKEESATAKSDLDRIDMLAHEENLQDLIAATSHERTVKVEVAVDSGAVATCSARRMCPRAS